MFLSVKQMEEMKNGLGGGMFQPGCELQLTPSVGSGSLLPLSRTQDGSDGGHATLVPFLSLSLVRGKSQHGFSLRP